MTASCLPKKRHRVALASTAVIAIGAIASLIAIDGGRGSAPTSRSIAASPAAFVAASAQRTLARKTADVTVSGTVHAAGLTVQLHGDGEVNFTTNSMVLNIDSGHSLVENEVLAGRNLYFGLSVDGHNLAQMTGGRHWMRLPLADSGPENLTGGDPSSALSFLERQGASVKSLGTKNIDGESCSGYAVTPTEQAVLSGAQKEFAKLGLSPAETSTGLQALESVPPSTVTVWVDSHQLTRQMSVALQLNGVAASGSIGGQVAVDFTHYGVPVHIATPALSDTLSYQQFIQQFTKTVDQQIGS